MAKRFIDTGIFRKPSIRAMKAPYKALFIYLLCECDHAGVWEEEIDVAAMRLGMDLDRDTALAELGASVIAVGSKWYLTDFVAYQYGELNPANRVHASVISRLQSIGIDPNHPSQNKPLTSPLKGAKDMDKDKDSIEKKERATEKTIDLPFASEAFATAWSDFETMRKRWPMTAAARRMILSKLERWGEAAAIESLNKSTMNSWRDVFEPKPVNNGTHAATLKTANPNKVHTGKL